MTNKEEYRQLAPNWTSLPLFFQPWYLDCTTIEGQWDVVFAKNKSKKIVGVYVFFIKKKYGTRYITHPPLTPYLGHWMLFNKNKATTEKENTRVIRLHKDLIDKLPKVMLHQCQFHPFAEVPLAFYWSGFQLSSRYTYFLDANNWNENDRISSKQRYNIRHAEQTLDIIESNDIEIFYRLNKMSFEGKNRSIPYSLSFLKNLDQALSKNSQRRITLAIDHTGQPHSGLYLTWDNQCAYCLAIGNCKDHINGSASMLIKDSINFSFSKVSHYDFEGSMIPSIEKFFRSFGGYHQPYIVGKRFSSVFWKSMLTMIGK